MATPRQESQKLARGALLVALFFVLATPAALREMDALLRGMHRPGDAAYGLGALGGLHPDSRRPEVVLRTWRRWFEDTSKDTSKDTDVAGVVQPRTVAHVSLLVDTFAFIPFYVFFLVFLLVQAYDHLRPAYARGPPERLKAYREMTVGAGWVLGFAVGADLVENIASWVLIGDPGKHFWYWVLYVATILKWSLLALVWLVLVASWLAIGRHDEPGERSMLRRLWSAVVACRAQLLLVLVFAALMLGPSQVSGQATDVVRRWTDDLGGTIFPVLLTLALCAVVYSAARLLCLHAVLENASSPSSGLTKTLVTMAFVGAAILALLQGTGSIHGGSGLYVPLGIIVVVAALSWPAQGITLAAGGVPAAPAVPALLAAVPAIVFGLATIRAAVGDYFFSHNDRELWVLGIGLVVLLGGSALVVIADRGRLTSKAAGRAATVVVGLATGAALGLAIALWVDLWGMSAPLGAVGVIVAFLICAAVFGFWLVMLGEVVPPPGVFLALGLRRIPVLPLLLLWLVLASTLDRKGTYHDVRTLHLEQSRPSPLGLQAAFERGVDQAALSTSGHAMPLVFVSAAGGGIRAAYWTDLVLDCVFTGSDKAPCGTKPADPASIFASSGVSGGALGLAEYYARRLHPEDAPGSSWVKDRLGGEFVAPTLAAMFFRDLPNAFGRFDEWDDRAGILERAWERAWPHGHRALTGGLYANESQLPLILFDGTSVADGCRFNTSVLVAAVTLGKGDPADDCLSLRRFEQDAPADPSACEVKSPPPGECEYQAPSKRARWAFAATHDVSESLCPDADLRLSTAALLAARFPFVSPSGRLACAGRPTAFVVDGGYFDNTGVSPIIELWQALEPRVATYNARSAPSCLVPVLLEIDNHYSEPHGPKIGWRPSEILVPTSTITKVRDGREAEAREAAALIFGGEEVAPGARLRGVDRVAHIFPRTHPGTTAPLGWTLSDAAQDDLRGQLGNRFNRAEIEKTRNWFSGKLACPSGDRPGGAGPFAARTGRP
jgi:hypothetical protein